MRRASLPWRLWNKPNPRWAHGNCCTKMTKKALYGILISLRSSLLVIRDLTSVSVLIQDAQVRSFLTGRACGSSLWWQHCCFQSPPRQMKTFIPQRGRWPFQLWLIPWQQKQCRSSLPLWLHGYVLIRVQRSTQLKLNEILHNPKL